jgi:hypothetical protein
MEPCTPQELDQLVAEVRSTRIKLDESRYRVAALEHKLRQRSDRLERMCPHPRWTCTPNDDYHKPGVYFTCAVCGVLQCRRPSCGTLSPQ